MATDKVSMLWNTTQFNRAVNVFIVATRADVPTAINKIALDLLRRIVRRMPVKTGRARAGWKASGKELGLSIPITQESKREDSEHHIITNLDKYIVRMQNNVEYVRFLEFGSSARSPLGMVRISMAEIRQNKALTASLRKSLTKGWKKASQQTRFRRQREALRKVL